MQITEKLRNEILLSLPKLSVKDADKIAADIGISRDTVYRQFRKLRNKETVYENAVILALMELAAANKVTIVNRHKRVRVLEKQLSGIR